MDGLFFGQGGIEPPTSWSRTKRATPALLPGMAVARFRGAAYVIRIRMSICRLYGSCYGCKKKKARLKPDGLSGSDGA